MPPNYVLLQHVPSIIFVFCVGAAVGSFLNVVVHRLPAGMSLASPPSRCPICGVPLRFFSENLPILGWFIIRGRCRTCGSRVSARYMLVELAMALMFTGLYAILYLAGNDDPVWLRDVGGPWWYRSDFFRTWPAFFAVAVLVASLYAMTVIDARTFTIPIEIPRFATFAAFLLLAVQALLPAGRTGLQTWPFHGADWAESGMAIGGMIGVLIAWSLLVGGVLSYSFEDYEDYVEEGETIGEYPHARREMKHELLFLVPVLGGAAAGWFIGNGVDGVPPRIVQAIGGCGLGYLAGAGIVWAVRILGTLGFGREAMGMGDVHLMGAVGAVLGWPESILIFFLAPFSGIALAIVGAGASGLFKARWRHLPYGPHLAAATILVLLGRPWVDGMLQSVFGFALPGRGLVG